ncbi:MAG: glycosyltransferase family 2 protein [Chloroflexota bacterium]
MSDHPDLSIIIVNWNTRELLAGCLQSLHETVQQHSFETWLVDNASTDGSLEVVRERFPQTHVIANTENVGFVRANNQALERCQGRYVLLLNSDTRVLPGSLDAAVHFMDAHPQAGLAGVRLLNADGSFQASYTAFPTLWREFLILTTLGRRFLRPEFPSYSPQVDRGPQEIAGYMEGAFLLARHEAVAQIGGLDERIFMYAEDVDWCYRFFRAGWQVCYLPDAPIVHYGGQSSKKRRGRMEAELYRSRVYFFHKHHGPAAAAALKALIYTLTLPKILAHRFLHILTRGRKGRVVSGWQELRQALGSVDDTFKERMAS